MRVVSRYPGFVAAGAAMLTAPLATGCDESLSNLAGPTPTLAPTFSSLVSEVFTSTDLAGRAACTNCHTNVGRSPAGGLTLLPGAAHAQLVGVNSITNPGQVRVVPGDPDNSVLIWKLEGRSGMRGARMPFSGPPYLTEGQILIVRRWIERGAPND
jgi:hypothetical protein